MNPGRRDRWRPADVLQPLLSSSVAAGLVARAASELELARRELRLSAAESGLPVVQDYTGAVDKTILVLWDEVARASGPVRRPFERMALVAQGGYGRGELNLHSDIDLLAVVPDDMNEDEERGIRQLFHLLWDLHLDVGHATKTIHQCLETVGSDIDSATALIEARFLAGDHAVFDSMRERFENRLRRDQRRWFLEFRRRDWEERHARYGSSVYLLEPNVKESEGGLRDIHTLRWLEFLFSGTTSLKGLVESGLIREAELTVLLDSLDFLHRVRNQLHILEGRKSDLLAFEKQPRVAKALAYSTEGELLAEERFMRDYYALGRETFRIGQRVVGDLTEPSRRRQWLRREKVLDGPLRARAGEVYLAGNEEAYFSEDGARFVEIFARTIQSGCRVSEATKRAVEKMLARGMGADLSGNAAARDALLSLLKAPGAVGAQLRDMHECGVLSAYIPEFRRLFCMVRADSYHKYTVDEHTLLALESADRLRADDPATPNAVRTEAAQIARWDLLYLAILTHDIGKGEGHGHVLRGGQAAQRITARLHLPEAEAEIVRRLVLDHLKMIHVALRRDLEDPRVIERMARDVGDVEYLRMLYALTYCDLSAVSPDTWTEWKAALLAELAAKTASVLAGAGPAARAPCAPHENLPEQVRAHLTAPEQEFKVPLGDYLAELPERYLATTAPDLVAHHYEMLDALDEENRVIWELRHPPATNYSELTVVAYDRPGVFSVLCGALASKRINILSAQIFSTKGGGVIDRFQVQDIRGDPLPEGFVLERLRNDVNRIFCGRKSADELFKDMPRERISHRPDLERIAPPAVVVDNESSEHSTIIEVKGYDRIGFLYDVTRVFTRHNLSIDLALITTEAYRVVDVFYVTDSDNNKLDDPAAIEQLRTELLEVISQ